MAKRSVALCITDLDLGGAEMAMVELATRLAWNRFEPVVYCLGSRPQSEEASCVPLLEDAGIEFQFLNAESIWRIQPTIRQLEQLLRRQQPALIQSFLFHANIVSRFAGRRAGVPVILSGLRVAERRRWHLWTDRLTAASVDCYVCVSQAVARFAERRINLPQQKLVVIPNGIDVEKFTLVPPADLTGLGVPRGSRVATFIGRLDRQKGVPWLLRAAPLWLNRLPDAHLLIVGKGPLEGQLRQICQRAAIASRVTFAGWRADVPEILAASQLLLLPSRWEGMPNVVLQAMASGLPVVATEVEGVRELLGPEADCQVVRFGDSTGFVSKIVAFLSHRAQSAQTGSRNRQRSEQMFSYEQMTRSYQDLWESLLEASQAAGKKF